jgi:hypothetical protein
MNYVVLGLILVNLLATIIDSFMGNINMNAIFGWGTALILQLGLMELRK